MYHEEKLVLFCQLTAQYLDELAISDDYRLYEGIEYPLIYPKTA